MNNSDRIIIVGGGMAGLSCGVALKEAGREVLILEQSDIPGGRVSSVEKDGFIMDVGFQVLLEAYPDARALLDYDALDLKPFAAGAQVFDGKQTHIFCDPLKHPRHLFSALSTCVASTKDKMRLLSLRRKLAGRSLESLFSGPTQSVAERWAAIGFSDTFVQRFLTPFYEGVFLSTPDHVPAQMFDFTFAMFNRGRASIPAGGMKAIPAQLAHRLGNKALRCGVRVAKTSAHSVETEAGEVLEAGAVVLAHPPKPSHQAWNGVTCLYYRAPSAPFKGPWITLNGCGSGRINQVVVPSNTAPSYAPQGESLISVSLNGNPSENDSQLFESIQSECVSWFGTQAQEWRPLQLFRIPHALPSLPLIGVPKEQIFRDDEGRYRCGDDMLHPSMQGALESGRKVAELISQA